MNYTEIDINQRVEKIKNDEGEINSFIDEYKPFIASCVQKATGRYVRYGEDDELSIAMIAFAEAIKTYSADKGGFISLARTVINRRLIDYYRKERKHANVVPMSLYKAYDDDEERELDVNKSIRQFSESKLSEFRRMEIAELSQELSEWGISFSELVEASPKQDKTRRIYSEMINFLMKNSRLVSTLREKKYLPVADIEKGTGISRKKIDRARKYIIAAVIILTGDYQYISEYINI